MALGREGNPAWGLANFSKSTKDIDRNVLSTAFTLYFLQESKSLPHPVHHIIHIYQKLKMPKHNFSR